MAFKCDRNWLTADNAVIGEVDLTKNSVGLALDVSAITMSGLCLAHCLLLPLFVAILPMAGVLAEEEWIHKVFVITALPISGFLIVRGKCTIGRSIFVALAVAGLGLLMAGAFVEQFEAFETPITVAGALLLACAHLWRWTRHSHTETRGQSQ